MLIASLDLIVLLAMVMLALFYTELFGSAQPDPMSEKTSIRPA